jgi:hypothetical protein
MVKHSDLSDQDLKNLIRHNEIMQGCNRTAEYKKWKNGSV